MADKRFNVRVYGLLLWQNRVLVTDEWLGGRGYTKFPGGGLEWGEGTADCLQREFQEELGLSVEPAALFYLNDFFQPSAFQAHHQVISIYYVVRTQEPQNIPVKSKAFDFDTRTQGEIVARWVHLDQLQPADFHFPIDKVVVELLVKRGLNMA